MDVDAARHAFEHRAWRDAYDGLHGAALSDVDDLERLAVAAHMIGRDAESVRAWERSYAALVAAGDVPRAVRCAFWLGLGLLLRGEAARATGWLSRAERIADTAGSACPANGYLLVPTFLDTVGRGDGATADVLSQQILQNGRQCGDPDLVALGTLAAGQAAITSGEFGRGLRLLDEVMVSVAAGEVSPIATGVIYCAVIEACVGCFDVRRATEWTNALDEWCSAQPDLVPYRGQCLVHRSQILQAHGEWQMAMAEAHLAIERLAAHPAQGLARYQLGELHRVRGELREAARAYGAASELGRDPAPGFALLRLAEGKVDAAHASVARMLAEAVGAGERPAILAAAVEIDLAAGDIAGAQAASDALTALAAKIDAPMLSAIAQVAAGRVGLEHGEAEGALVTLRRAAATWHALGMPYEEARTRVALAAACGALGDGDGALIETEAARSTFERLGATCDLDRLASAGRVTTRHPGALTGREVEVLVLLATGRTNREIAATLSISVHTVARHVQNIFVKLGVSTRAAATAYAYEHGVVR